MVLIPAFNSDGLLPAGDHEVSLDELRQSVLVSDPGSAEHRRSWDAGWRRALVDNLETLTRQLWRVGVNEVFADGSFAEDKDHPNDSMVMSWSSQRPSASRGATAYHEES